jgi:hypothetical protein
MFAIARKLVPTRNMVSNRQAVILMTRSGGRRGLRAGSNSDLWRGRFAPGLRGANWVSVCGRPLW